MEKFLRLAIVLALLACSGNSSAPPAPDVEAADSNVLNETEIKKDSPKADKDVLANYAQRVGKEKQAVQEELTNSGANDLILHPAGSVQDLEKLSNFLLRTHEGMALDFLQWSEANFAATEAKYSFTSEVIKAKQNNSAIAVSQVPTRDLALYSVALRDTVAAELRTLGVENLRVLNPAELSPETAAKMTASLQEALAQRLAAVEAEKIRQAADLPIEVEADRSSGALAHALCLVMDQQIVAFIPAWNGEQATLIWTEVEQYGFPLQALPIPTVYLEKKKQALASLDAKDKLAPSDQLSRILLEKQIELGSKLLK